MPEMPTPPNGAVRSRTRNVLTQTTPLRTARPTRSGLFEINEAASLVQDAAHAEANIIFGTVIDDSLGDEVRVTVIAAGFDAAGPSRKPMVGGAHAAEQIAPGPAGRVTSPLFEPADAVSVPVHTNGSTVSIGGDDDDVDVPPFMRH